MESNNLEKLKDIVSFVKGNLKTVQDKDGHMNDTGTSQISDIVTIAESLFPLNAMFFRKVNARLSSNRILTGKEAQSILEYVDNLMGIEKKFLNHMRDRKIFESARDKLDQAIASLKNSDYPSVLNNLNTSLELTLKDTCNIPATLSQINTGRIIDLLTARNVGPVDYLKEVKRLVLSLDNKTKHQGYTPSKVDSINAIKALDDLNDRLKQTTIEITEELRREIYGVL